MSSLPRWGGCDWRSDWEFSVSGNATSSPPRWGVCDWKSEPSISGNTTSSPQCGGSCDWRSEPSVSGDITSHSAGCEGWSLLLPSPTLAPPWDPLFSLTVIYVFHSWYTFSYLVLNLTAAPGVAIRWNVWRVGFDLCVRMITSYPTWCNWFAYIKKHTLTLIQGN